MVIENCEVLSLKQLNANTFLIEVRSEVISRTAKPGQFCNIKVSDTDFPLLRRPFSICDIDGESLFFMFDIVGEGTKILSQKVQGDTLNILGPLGNGFNLDDNFSKAIFIAGGIGVAPFAFLERELSDKETVTLLGGRSKQNIIDYKLKNVKIATDDGSLGMRGNVIDLLDENKELLEEDVKIFACGPTPMFVALKKYLTNFNAKCEVSTESAMACGFGICQGCPIELANGEGYKLICKDGPVFNINEIKL